MFYDEKLAVTLNNLKKLSVKTAEYNESDVDMYAWIVDNGGDNGISWLGTACKTGTGEKSKTSITRGPSRHHAIIETAEVSVYSTDIFMKSLLSFYKNGVVYVCYK